MSKNTVFFGIDISKDVFDVTNSIGNYWQFTNDAKGFKSFQKLLNKNSHCVMESTGYYHLQLAHFLFKNDIRVSVENALSVKRFIQMHLSKIKTDKADSKMICLYAQQAKLKLWNGITDNKMESLQISRLIDVYIKQSTAIKNKIHGEEVLGIPSKLVYKSLKKSLSNLQKQLNELESHLIELVKQDYQETLTLLQTIPGMGKKTAAMLIVFTDGFNRFEKANQVCSYVGITPIIRQSGSSVRGKARISKMGNRRLRNLLFMCSFTASTYNPACNAIYQRIVNKGKSKKLALIAVSNKLVKQAFAIAKSGLPYDPNYKSVQVV